MGLIIDDQIPVCCKYCPILLIFPARKFRSSQILHGRKINERRSFLYEIFQPAVIVSINTGINCRKTIFFLDICLCEEYTVIIENLIKIRLPSINNRRTMRNYKYLAVSHLLNKRVCRNRLAEPHLTVPEHPVTVSKYSFCFADAGFLFLAENNLRSRIIGRINVCEYIC